MYSIMLLRMELGNLEFVVCPFLQNNFGACAAVRVYRQIYIDEASSSVWLRL
jgi:hypothetical protein